MTNTSRWPGIEQSSFTITRPCRSSGTPSVAPSGEAALPAAQITVRAGIFSPPLSVTPSAETSSTSVRKRTSTPRSNNCRRALSDRSDVNCGITRGAFSMSSTRACEESMWRKSFTSVTRAISAMAPAISTPVGPPPTTTKVIAASRSSSSSVFSAISKASSMRRRISSASSRLFSPGANFSHRSLPKYECRAPVARMRKS